MKLSVKIGCLGVLILFFNCKTPDNHSNKIPFTIDSTDRKINLCVTLFDSLKATFVFDSPALGIMKLDSTFCAKHPISTWNDSIITIENSVGSAWSNQKHDILWYHKSLELNVSDAKLQYDWFNVSNLKNYFNSKIMDGIFSIPSDDTIHIWELNFSQNYLQIHNATNYTLPPDCIVFPFEERTEENSLRVRIPFRIKFADGDTLTVDHSFVIDTGMPWDIMLIPPTEEIDYFDEKEAVWTCFGNSYHRRYTVNASISQDCIIDSLRIYTLAEPYYLKGNFIGLNFLKRFNVFFDMHNRQLGLQPIKNFKRAVNPNYRRFHLSFREDSSGKRIVNKVADYKGNRYKEAGIQEGDQILSVNDSSQVKVFNIIRNGKPLRITVIDDPNEEQGD